jgi:hypothetical protein
MQEAARERVADEVLAKTFPPIPEQEDLREEWQDILNNSARVPHELARLERRQLKLREALRLLLNAVKNPKAKGIDEMLINVYNTLLFWDDD